MNKQGDCMLSYRLLASSTALVAGLSIFSGTASAMSFGVGPLFGVNLGNASVDAPSGATQSFDTEMLTRFAFGARAEFGVTSPFSLLLEPMFLQRGATESVKIPAEPGFPGGTVKSDVRMNYLEMPVLAKAKFGSMKAHAYAFAGPSLGLFLNGETESDGQTDKMDHVTNFNLSGDVGVGGSYQLQEFIYLNADVRYSMGFINAIDVSDAGSWKNRDIRFQLCVLFHLLK
jgi:hypothetical protein